MNVNTTSPTYNRNLLKNILEKHSETVLFAYLFGSCARNDETERSDIDIAVFLKDRNAENAFDIKMALYLDFSRTLKKNDIDILVMNRCRNIVLLHDVVATGHVIYDQDEDVRLDYEQKLLHRAIDFKRQRFMAMGV